MKRKSFLKKGIIGLGTLITAPSILNACCKSDDNEIKDQSCTPTPTEIAGPFPIKSPASMVKSNIIGDREGIPLMINIVVQNTEDNCNPVEGIKVDIWQCDAHGNYSEYNNQLDGDFTAKHFLRGRQVTDVNGMASFISIYPGWYPGRAPHLHLELKNSSDQSLLITQIAFPEDISSHVYTTSQYKGDFDTSNGEDGSFGSSVNLNMADTVTGDLQSGYILTKTVKTSI